MWARRAVCLLLFACATTSHATRSSLIAAIQQYDDDTARLWRLSGMANGPMQWPTEFGDLNEAQLREALAKRRKDRTLYAKVVSQARAKLDEVPRQWFFTRAIQSLRTTDRDSARVEAFKKEAAALDALIAIDSRRAQFILPELPMAVATYERNSSAPPDAREALWRALEDKTLEVDRIRSLLVFDESLLRAEIEELETAIRIDPKQKPWLQPVRDERAAALESLEQGRLLTLTP